jgi:nucleoside-diphosphate-sugar epimerase
MPRALVTGAAGFLGSHISDYLLERGYSVVGMDNLLTGDLANIQHLTGRDFVFVKHDVTNYGDGAQTRSLCYVSDLVDGLYRLITSDIADPVNIGNPQELTIRQLAERIIALTGSRSRIVSRPLPVDDPRVRQPDITRARNLLGWEPKVPLDVGLAHTLAYFKGKLGL